MALYRSKGVNIHMEHVYTHLYAYGCAQKLKHLIFVNGGSIFDSALAFKDRRSISITHASYLLFCICLSSAHPLHSRSIDCPLLTAMFHLFSIHAWHLLFFIYILGNLDRPARKGSLHLLPMILEVSCRRKPVWNQIFQSINLKHNFILR